MAGYLIFVFSLIVAHIQGAAIDLAECGKTKGCFGLPKGCIKDSTTCTAVATWKPNGNKISFELSTKAPANAYYVAFGILEAAATRGMGNAIVMDCIGNSGNPTMAYSTNVGTVNTPLAGGTPGITVTSTEYASGEIRCFFDRDTTVSSNAANFMDIGAGNSYKVNMAIGVTNTGGKTYHFANKLSSDQAVDFTQTQDTSGSAPQSGLDVAECGKSKGCFGLPQGCLTDSSCTAVATWKPNGNKISFELKTKTTSNAYYVAFGILEPQAAGNMGNAIVMDCIGNSGNPTVSYSTNVGQTNKGLAGGTPGITVTSTEFANGELKCIFDRDTSFSSNAANFLDIGAGNSYKVNMAIGAANNGAKSYHFGTKVYSEQAVDFTQTTVASGSATRSIAFVKAHGSLMIIAWILMAGTAITLARYFKDMWPGRNVPVYDKPIWFSFHSMCNTLAFLSTVAAFVLIFYYKQEWSDLSGESPKILQSHPILGIIVTACAIINPVMAIFRPHPGAKRRPIFNWMHWIVGTIALIAGTLTVFSGLNLQLSKSFTTNWMTRLLLAFVVFALVIDIVLEILRCMVNKRTAQAEIEMTAPGEPPQDKPSKPTPPASALRNVLFFLYFIFALGTTVALVVGIAIN